MTQIFYAFVICDSLKYRQKDRHHQGCFKMRINSQVVKAHHQKYIGSKVLKQRITLCDSFRG